MTTKSTAIATTLQKWIVASVDPSGRVTSCSPVQRQPGPAFMDTRYFDMTLDDGRVYRVRVSDITPEDASETRVKEST